MSIPPPTRAFIPRPDSNSVPAPRRRSHHVGGSLCPIQPTNCSNDYRCPNSNTRTSSSCFVIHHGGSGHAAHPPRDGSKTGRIAALAQGRAGLIKTKEEKQQHFCILYASFSATLSKQKMVKHQIYTYINGV
jgi:hypothetical protein